MISQHDCVAPFVFYYVMGILLVSVMRYEFLCVRWLKISPVLLLKIMIVHSHLNLAFLLLTACVVVQLFAIVEKFVGSVDRCRIVISQSKMMASQVLQFFRIQLCMLNLAPVLHQGFVGRLERRVLVTMLETWASERILSLGLLFVWLPRNKILCVDWTVWNRAASQDEMTCALVHYLFLNRNNLLESYILFHVIGLM